MAGDARLEWFYTRAAPFFCEAGRSDVVIDDGQAILTFLDQGEVGGPALLLYREELIKASGPLQENKWAANAAQQTSAGKLSAKGPQLSPSGRENSTERAALTQLKGADAAPETEATHQLDADGAAPISPTLSTPAPDAEKPSLSKPGLAATTRLEQEDLEKALQATELPQGPSLDWLQKQLLQYLLPKLAPEAGLRVEGRPQRSSANQPRTSVPEFVANLQRFCTQLGSTLQQLNGSVRLHVPDLPIKSAARAAEDEFMLMELEKAVAEWTASLGQVMDEERTRAPQGPGPSAEVEFWRPRAAMLMGLSEQLNLPRIRMMVDAVELGSSDQNLLSSFRIQHQDVKWHAEEAGDNLKFLSTLERHFKAIEFGPLDGVADVLPPLMGALRLVWVISRHYSQDVHMASLMQRIAVVLGNCIEGSIDLLVLFGRPAAESMQVALACKHIADTWQGCYLATREAIETAGRDPRWEFSKQVLFERTNYMGEICGDLASMLETVDDFRKFLGPELKAVTGDTQAIEAVGQQVQGMMEQVTGITFPLFSKQHAADWAAVRASFAASNQEVQGAFRALIDTSFRKLRSVEAALDLLDSFRSMQSGAAVQQLMASKLTDILNQFSREIDGATTIFHKSKESPPAARNQPPMAGAIQWARALFARVRRTMDRVSVVQQAGMQHELMTQVTEQFKLFGRGVMDFEKTMFNRWKDVVEQNALPLLKQPILAEDSEARRVVVNFSPTLTNIIRETRALDRLKFELPDAALNIALQEPKFQQAADALSTMLQQYHQVVENLTPVERELLNEHLLKLRHALDPGFAYLNWTSLGVLDFVAAATKAVNEFQTLLTQVQKSAGLVEKTVQAIAQAQILKEPPGQQAGDVPNLQELYEHTESCRLEVVDDLSNKYNGIPPHLRKIEELVSGTNTGKAPALAPYYQHWEALLFSALTAFVLASMRKLLLLFNPRHGSHSASTDRPLFQVTLLLSSPEITVQPSLNEVKRVLGRLMRCLVESAKPFARWMDGTCILCPAQPSGPDDEDPFLHSFYGDVSQHPHVVKAMLALSSVAQAAVTGITRCMDTWRIHQPLWKQDKVSWTDKFIAKNPATASYEERMARYTKNAAEIWRTAGNVDCGFVRIRTQPLAAAVRDEALGWVKALRDGMQALDLQTLQRVKDTLASIRQSLQLEPKTLDDLKNVLRAIALIRDSAMVKEISFTDLEERFRHAPSSCLIRLQLGYASDGELTKYEAYYSDACEMKKEWKKLQTDSMVLDDSLADTKDTFAQLSTAQAQEFVQISTRFLEKLKTTGPGVPGTALPQGLTLLTEFQVELREKASQRDQLVSAQRLFGLDAIRYPALAQAEIEMRKLQQIYAMYTENQDALKDFLGVAWGEADTSKLTIQTQELQKRLLGMKQLSTMPTFSALERELQGCLKSLGLIKELHSDAMRKRHWEQIAKITGGRLEADIKSMPFSSILGLHLDRHEVEVAAIINAASKELTIELELKKLNEVWREQRLEIFKYTRGGAEERGLILRGTDEVTKLLEDVGLNLQSIMTSKFVRPFSEEVHKWETRLSLVSECLEVWLNVQRKWMYLETIFSLDDICNQLPQEAQRFSRIDKGWKKIMGETAKNTNVIEACTATGRKDTLQSLSNELELCQKSLSEYLEIKRCAFPRFYFVSDDELLSVLGSSDPTSIQEHSLKLFDNCGSLKFARGNKVITGMISSEGEPFSFLEPVDVEGAVEIWMGAVEAMMKKSLHQFGKEAVAAYPDLARGAWLQKTLGMLGLAGATIWWTWETEDALQKMTAGTQSAMKDLSARLTDQLTDLTKMVGTLLSSDLRRKVNTLIILDVHARDIIDLFVRDTVMDVRDFAWESQLRYYWDRGVDDIMIRQCTGLFQYGYEYTGLSGRLVITALTDRCYMTLTTALSFMLGGAPSGPAGTGKTETTKDLAKSLGLQCVVFNCGEGLDYKAMASIFSGLSQCGAWGCFDEFNRIEAEVLSVVSSQIRQIQEALKMSQTRFTFEGRELALRNTVGIFITMNPGYAGRTELPDNLKALFRPVTMVVPDQEQICEIMLFSEGFVTAKVLAKKMTVLYSLARAQLSKQHHYDFGLRALKSVLVMAGSLKRAAPGLPESMVLMRALRDMNLPKFVYEDVPLFKGLLIDLFPGMDCPRVQYEELNRAVEIELRQQGLQVLQDSGQQVDKIVQLYEVLMTRHTVMVVGKTSGGKSVVINTLAKAQTRMGKRTTLSVVNPKAVTVPELYGQLDPETRDWTDGLLSSMFREINKPLTSGKDEARYILFDGDVDAVWVESMNSVMDDNKLLTLANGERIRLQPYARLLFEVGDLQYASPATVSRCGMVYVDPRDLGVQPAIDSWLAAHPIKSQSEALLKLFASIAVPLTRFVHEGLQGTELVPKPALRVPDTEGSEAGVGSLPSGSLYDYRFDTGLGAWKLWDSYKPAFSPPVGGRLADALVPSVDTVRTAWLLQCALAAGRPCLLSGESGIGKTVTIMDYLRGQRQVAAVVGINFSSRTTSADVQRTVEGSVEKRTKDVYGASGGRKLLLFLDDLNMPHMDTYGTQQPIALLKLLLERKGLYDRGKDLSWRSIKDVQAVAAMGPTGGARNPVDARFLSLFHVYEVSAPSLQTQRAIFNTILDVQLVAFPADVRGASRVAVDCLLELYAFITKTLPPTPSRFHYTFNLRDLSRVTSGMLLADPAIISTGAALARLWRNECLRIFHDRLICADDRQMVQSKISGLLESFAGGADGTAKQDPILYSFVQDPEDTASSVYRDIASYDGAKSIWQQLLLAYNSQRKSANLVFFVDALDHLTRLHRVLSLPQGNALLVGVAGSGKQSLARLAAFAAKQQVYEITLSRGYSESSFREDLKKIYQLLGPEGQKVMFLFTDAHIVEEGFLELVNNMLSTGMVPALFTDSERDALVDCVRDEVAQHGGLVTREALWNAFAERCRCNLHIVLAMSPVGEDLRRRCRNFPALVNNCVIDWFDPWPAQALESVAGAFLQEGGLIADGQHRTSIAGHMVKVHQGMTGFATRFQVQLRRRVYVTPKTYLDYIAAYQSTLSGKRTELTAQSSRLDGGLSKLIQASAEVDVMTQDLKEAQIVVGVATNECNSLLETIASSTGEVETKQTTARSKEQQLQIDSANIAVEKEGAEAALAEAIPILEEAAQALNDLKRDDITEIRSFAKPHILVQKVCECVVILRNLKEVSWAGAKSMMADTNFLKSLVEFDKDGLTEKQVKQVRGYMKDESFTLDNIRAISSAGAGLLKWVFAMVNYYDVAKGVEPKRKKVADSERNLRIAERDLATMQEQVTSLTDQLAQLRAQFESKTNERVDLKDKADVMERRLEAASRLILGLASERSRWTSETQALEAQMGRLLGDCLLAAGFLCYCGPFTYDFRQAMMIDTWLSDIHERHLPVSRDFRLQKLLTNDVETTSWAAEGLPADDLSVQNGILTCRASRWPLCIDPQMQAVTWIKRREGKQLEGKMKSFNDSDALKQLELAIQYGLPFLFENIDEYIDPVVDPVLEKNFVIKAGGRKSIKLGDKEIDWDDNFRLYMCTKLPNPQYGPEVAGKTIIINYSVTQQGLTDQLLNVVVRHERADLEEARESLVKQMSSDRSLLQQLEDTLLSELSNATGNILDNTVLISTLEEAKAKAVEISDKLKESAKTAGEIEQARAQFKPAAVRGAVLFFVMEGLAAISYMYQHSLSSFLDVFNMTLDTSDKAADLAQRLKNILEALTWDIFSYVCLGLFEQHKLMFAFQITCKIMQQEGLLDPAELDFFIKGKLSLDAAPQAKPAAWIPDQGWQDLMYLSQEGTSSSNPEAAAASARLAPSLQHDLAAWKAWFDHSSPEDQPLPKSFDDELSAMQKLLVLRCLRVDRVTVAAAQFVAGNLGDRFVRPPVLDYKDLLQRSNPTTPIVFVLSPGADPAFGIFRLGEEVGMKPGMRLKHLALGQGMGPRALELITAGVSRGIWVLLQNCHLLPKFMPLLEKALDKLDRPHKDFRLWLTTEPTDRFPLGILQRSLKVVTEPPSGLKLNMLATYARISDETFSECQHPGYADLVWTLAFFHAVVQERRKYGKLGWNVPYDFNETDFRISLSLVATYLTKAFQGQQQESSIPWTTLRYLVGEAMYGGRVSDSYDRRVLVCYLEEFLGDFLFDAFKPFCFFQNDQVSYRIPQQRGKGAHITAIEDMPLRQTPDVLGLHPSADVAYLTDATRALWRDLLSMQPRTAPSSSGLSRDAVVEGTAKGILNSLPRAWDMPSIRKRLGTTVSPTEVVLLQELEHYNQVNGAMRKSLRELQQALAGVVGFSAALEELAGALFNNQLPSSWARLCPPSSRPLTSWLLWMQRRHEQFVAWVQNGEPAVMWLAGLHAPETYIAALVQTACRTRGWPLDRASLTTAVTRFSDAAAVKTKPALGCYIQGLSLEGAVLIFEADLATKEHSSHWTLQGVALTLNAD
ncbi:hypothetical protein WJX84_008574 [Apatococcus fuscideae]|uniref:AAA+ ATPase domain-containing protein n=1 Tax=Apatococcus fuscideae TaxID=2026836 RepID=A0AAW1TGG5_9CHLO